MPIQVGEPAPDFSLPNDQGGVFTLSQRRGQRVLLVFYPGDDTPVCTAQLCDYRDGIEAFADLDVDVVGISPDSAESHRRFRERHALPFELLVDADAKVAKAWGAYGLLGYRRAVFLVDAQGVVRYAHVETVALFRRERGELLDLIRRLPE